MSEINIIMDETWNAVKRNSSWLNETLNKYKIRINDKYEELYGETQSIGGIISKAPYGSITAGSNSKLKTKTVQLIKNNLSDLNNLLGTDYFPSEEELSDSINIGYLKYVHAKIRSNFEEFKSVYPNDPPLFQIPAYLTTPRGISLILDVIFSPGDPSYSTITKKISLCNNRPNNIQQLFALKKVDKRSIMHEYTHKITDKQGSQIRKSKSARESIAYYSPKILYGKQDKETDLDILIQDYFLLYLSRAIINNFNGEKDLEIHVNNAPETKIDIKGFASIMYLVDKKGESIIPEIMHM
ncbi:MAG: hypothetical protein KAI51_01000 [Candidatus Aenigmarchaeota archaeon]|nr:hypothetical protein [Candidatus Aenigmarchaeota archaeon]MCK5042754.1 hypothetical protein [Candidatus Aenigmarchaeota archaeon]MCK5063063.1 hypothetical protein [Candidatus Aenigmarchaeota archaeon]MCK5451988.1 hypothetical protein [Candidatus Aenigmarchaeota archaeon]